MAPVLLAQIFFACANYFSKKFRRKFFLNIYFDVLSEILLKFTEIWVKQLGLPKSLISFRQKPKVCTRRVNFLRIFRVPRTYHLVHFIFIFIYTSNLKKDCDKRSIKEIICKCPKERISLWKRYKETSERLTLTLKLNSHSKLCMFAAILRVSV